jgi:hypothetical protein
MLQRNTHESCHNLYLRDGAHITKKYQYFKKNIRDIRHPNKNIAQRNNFGGLDAYSEKVLTF